MNTPELIAELKRFLAASYPDIRIDAKPWQEDPSRLALYFTEQKFSALYPQQRYHYLVHNIPQDFFNRHLTNSVWFELAPGEAVQDLRYPDEELITSISSNVLATVERAGVFSALDDLLAPESSVGAVSCHGDFRHTKDVLKQKGFGQRGDIDEVFDICHVFMARGGYCDCEVLFNVSETNRLKSRYWKKRPEEAQLGAGPNERERGHDH
jgi:hypothetical protein